MSWHFSRALVAEYSAVYLPDSIRSVRLKSTTIVEIRYVNGKTMESSILSTFGMTYGRLMELIGKARSTLSPRASHASPLVPREKNAEIKTNETCGQKHCEYFAKYSQTTHSWKMSQGCLALSGQTGGITLDEYSEIWPKQGMMRDGVCYQQPTLALRISESDFGYTLPTPTAMDHKAGRSSAMVDDGPTRNLRDWFTKHYRLLYPPVAINEWLLGMPVGFTDLEPLAMDKFRQWQQQHGKY